MRRFRITAVVHPERVESWRLDLYTARVYPAIRGETLELLNDWIVWGTVLDDYVETNDPAEIAPLLRDVCTVLRCDIPEPAPPGAHPLLAGLADLTARTLCSMPEGLRARTTQDFVAWITTYLEDATHRRQQFWLTLWSHIERRQHTSAMFPYSDLSEHTYECHLTERVVCSGIFKALRIVATEHVGLLNDVYSCHREESRGDNHNAVLVAERHFGYSRESAIEHVITLVDERMRLFVALREASATCTAEFTPDECAGLRRMAEALGHWIIGNLDWHELAQPRRYDERGKWVPPGGKGDHEPTMDTGDRAVAARRTDIVR
ncbi:terpene synthase family protein [Nocardia sp. NPDC052566]|uniref:terpene synthase family protein n=1 Tax=Nocardia sp. NPDC052566 TaxID=3364330 RepID=UPI0037C71B28